jgi:hypothetical protein
VTGQLEVKDSRLCLFYAPEGICLKPNKIFKPCPQLAGASGITKGRIDGTGADAPFAIGPGMSDSYLLRSFAVSFL